MVGAIGPLFEVLYAAIVTAMMSAGGKDYQLIAAYRGTLGRRYSLLGLAGVIAVITACAAAAAGISIADLLPPRARTMLWAFALGLAGLELLWPVRMPTMNEPTRSLGAIALVVCFRQLTDAPRLLVFAFAIVFSSPVHAIIGGALGSVLALAQAWRAEGNLKKTWGAARFRLLMGLAALATGIYVGVLGRGALTPAF